MTRFAVIDTNVVVSGLLSGAADSPTRLVVDAMLAGTISFALSQTLLAEYRAVLLRSAIRERHGLSEPEVDLLLEEMVLNSSLRHPDSVPHPLPPAAQESDARASGSVSVDAKRSAPSSDEHVIDLLRVVPEAVLVTGDRRLAEAVGSWTEALTPAEFVVALVGEGDG